MHFHFIIINCCQYQILWFQSYNLNKMQNESNSSLSDGSQAKYQKAVKEISKLINYNNSLSKQLAALKQENQTLAQQNNEILNLYHTIQQERQKWELQVMDYQSQIQSLHEANQELHSAQTHLFTPEFLQAEQAKYSQQISMLKEKLEEQGQTIINLEDNIGKLQQDNKELKKNHDKAIAKFQEGQACSSCQDLALKVKQSAQYQRVLEDEIVAAKKGKILRKETQSINKHLGKDAKSMLIASLESRVRMLEEESVKKSIALYQFKNKVERLHSGTGGKKIQQHASYVLS